MWKLLFLLTVVWYFLHGKAQNVSNKRVSDEYCQHIDGGLLEFLFQISGSEINTKYHHMVAIGWTKDDGSIKYECGGTLVSTTFALTAAHCTSLNGKAPDTTLIGGLYLDEPDGFLGSLGIAQIFRHPKYKRRQVYHDIALLKLNGSAFFPPPCLWTKDQYDKTSVIVMGYGHTAFEGNGTTILKEAKLEIFSHDECSIDYSPRYKLEQGLIESQICAGDYEKKKDACQGDSGGPLLVLAETKEGRKRPFILGITSYGLGCAGGPPGIYTRVYSYLDWIESIVWPDQYEKKKQIGSAEIPELRMENNKEERGSDRSCIVGTTDVANDTRTDFTSNFSYVVKYPKFSDNTKSVGWPSSEKDQYFYKCGGVLIQHNFVLTTANCISSESTSPVVVVVGARILNDELPSHLPIKIKKIHKHPLYTGKYIYDDIALLELETGVLTTPACLWTREEFEKDSVIALGYSPIEFASNNSKSLIKTELTISTHEDCNKEDLSEFKLKKGLTESQMCAAKSDHDICQGGSGGPIILFETVDNIKRSYVLGITSNGLGCGNGKLGIYTRVHSYLDWIEGIAFSGNQN